MSRHYTDQDRKDEQTMRIEASRYSSGDPERDHVLLRPLAVAHSPCDFRKCPQNPNVVGSGYIQFAPQKPFERPVQMQPLTVAVTSCPARCSQDCGIETILQSSAVYY